MEKETLALFLNHYLSLATIVGGGVLVVFLGYIAYALQAKKNSALLNIVCDYILPLGFFMTVGGAFMTMFYSEYLHYVPCDLCWYQRVFLYPQIILFGYAWYKKDRTILPYNIILSVVGGAIAIYHHMLQIGYDIYKPCSTAPFAVDCAKPSFIEYGFVTFPLMSALLFAFLITLLVTSLKARHIQ